MADEPNDQKKPATPKMKRQKRVDAKHLAVARSVAGGKTLREAGEAAGYPAKSARQSAWEAMQTIKRKAPAVFDKHGLTLDSLAEDVNRLRRMKRVQYFAKDGIVLDEREHEAADIQIKAVDMALQVQGAYERGEDGRNQAPNSVMSNTFCVVTSDPETAKSLARLFSPRGTPNIVIDMDAQVDKNVG